MSDTDFYIVGVGASAGGLAPLKLFFEHLPERDINACFIVILHLPKGHQTHLHTILSGFTNLPVTLLEHDTFPEPGHVYVLPGQLEAMIKDGMVSVGRRKSDPLNRIIDKFFISLAKDRKQKAVGVLLSGAGKDGTCGMDEIHKNGGTVIVQDPATAEHTSMPVSAIGFDSPTIARPEMMGAIVKKLTNHQLSS